MFKAFKVFSEDGKISGRRGASSRSTSLSEGAVVIKAAFSSVNYKDALAATGAGKIMRRFPLDRRHRRLRNRRVERGCAFQRRRSRASSPVTTWASRTMAAIPATFGCRRIGSCPCRTGLTLFDTMAIGTAGFTAALSIVEMERNGLTPCQRPRDRDRRDRRRRQHRDSVAGGARLLGDGVDREGARSRLSARARCDRRHHAGLARDGHEAAREVDVGRRRGSRRRRRPRLADANDDVWRLHREFRADRRRRAQDHRAAVHPSWREAARDRFGDVPGRRRAGKCGVVLPATSSRRILATRRARCRSTSFRMHLRRCSAARHAADSSSTCRAHNRHRSGARKGGRHGTTVDVVDCVLVRAVRVHRFRVSAAVRNKRPPHRNRQPSLPRADLYPSSTMHFCDGRCRRGPSAMPRSTASACTAMSSSRC